MLLQVGEAIPVTAHTRGLKQPAREFFDCFCAVAEPGAGFDSRGLGLRAQKKLLGKMSSKKIAKAFIDDTTGRVLDNTYRIIKETKGGKKEAEKLMKYMIKTVVKVGLLLVYTGCNLAPES